MKKTGQFDILKIISIFMILTLHYLYNDFGGGMTNSFTVNGVLTHSLESVSIIGCNLFVLITSWFMFDEKEIKLKKIINIIIVILFYAIVIYLICLCFKIVQFNKLSIITFYKTIFNCWFIIIYLILYILIPYINKSLFHFTKSELLNLIKIMIIFFSIFPTFFTDITVRDNGYGIINFIMLYCIIYYIKKYCKIEKIKSYKILLIFIISTIITIIASFKTTKAWNYNSIFVIISSISLFLLFAKTNIRRNKPLMYISSFSLAIYIIHTNKFIINLIYRNIFKSNYYSHTKLLLVNWIITIVGIFIGCIIIEIIRRFIFKHTFDHLIQKTKLYNKNI